MHVLNFSHSECKISNTEAALVGKRDIDQVFVLTTQGISHQKKHLETVNMEYWMLYTKFYVDGKTTG